MRRGFTMIELIFVIVIIGILAVIAISKLNATRDDAKIVTELQNLSTCINDAGSAYTATGKEDVTSTACTSLKCFAVSTGSKNTDGDIEVTGKKIADQWCVDATKKAHARNLVDDDNGKKKVFHFGGSKIKE